MSEREQLKLEARKLLEEVNYQFERTTGKHNPGTVYNFEAVCESSFKNRLKQLRDKVASLQITSDSMAQRYNTLFSR